MSTSQTIPEDLRALVGEKLSAVTFVLDYWQLDFDGNGLSIMSSIDVVCSEGRTRDGENNFRDRLCGQISKIVRQVELNSDCLSVIFEDGSRIEASLRDKDYRGPEAIQFGKQGRIYVL